MSIKNGVNASFLVQSQIFPKLKAQTLAMRYQTVPVDSGFTVERKISDIINLLYIIYFF